MPFPSRPRPHKGRGDNGQQKTRGGDLTIHYLSDLAAMSHAAGSFLATMTGTLSPTLLHLRFLPIARSNLRISPSLLSPQLAARRGAPARVHRVEKEQRIDSESPISGWGDFASCVSGEWDGYGAEFTCDGKPIELPESVVPEAFRDWGVEVFDWQTQCPTLAEIGSPTVTYKLIKLLPTVGCEADAATRYSTEERVIDKGNRGVHSFVYDRGGCYVAIWNLKDGSEGNVLELEHCLVDPDDKGKRIRVIQVIQMEEKSGKLLKMKVFSENWYGPFRNGEQLGGCAIRESAFATNAPLKQSEVEGVWQGIRVSANFNGSEPAFRRLMEDIPEKLTRDSEGLLTLPKNLWCILKRKGGETCAEVGWLLRKGHATTSRCIFSDGGSLKSVVMAQEAAISGDN